MGASHGDIYEAIIDDEVYARLPHMIAELVGGRSCNLHRFDSHLRLTEFKMSYFTDKIVADLAQAHPDGLDIWTGTGFASGIRDRAVAMDKLVSPDAYRGSVLYNDVILANGDDTGRSVGIIQQVEDEMMCISVHRAFSQEVFSLQEVGRLDAIANDLHRIFRARKLIDDRERKISRLGQLLEASAARIFLLGQNLSVIEVSPAAEAMLAARDGIRSFGRQIRFSDLKLGAEVTRAVNATVSRQPTARSTFMCKRPSGQAPWRISILPTVQAGATACMMVVEDGRPVAAGLRRWLVDYYQATPAELEVAEELLRGRTPEEIGERRRVSINTVRSQVRRLLEKTGTRRVTELLILLASLG